MTPEQATRQAAEIADSFAASYPQLPDLATAELVVAAGTLGANTYDRLYATITRRVARDIAVCIRSKHP